MVMIFVMIFIWCFLLPRCKSSLRLDSISRTRCGVILRLVWRTQKTVWSWERRWYCERLHQILE